MVRLDACPPLPTRAIGPVAEALNRHFLGSRGIAAGPPRVHRASLGDREGRAGSPWGTSRRVRPPPTAPDRPRPRPGRDASPLGRAFLCSPRPVFPSPPSQAAPAPSRAREQTPWSVTRGVVAGVAFGALVIAGGALVAGVPLPPPSLAILARLGSSPSREPGPTDAKNADAVFFSLPSFERDVSRAKPAVADLGRAAAETRREEVSRKKQRAGGRSDDWGIEKTRAESSLGKKSLRGDEKDARKKKSLRDADLESDAELFEATLAFAKPRPEDERERRARSSAARKTHKRTTSKQTGEGKADEDDARLDRAIADELSDLAERDAAEVAASDGGDTAFEDETLDDLFEPADGSAASAREDGAISLDALAAEAASEMGEARGEDAAPEPEDSAAPEPEDSAAPEPEDSAAPEPDDPNVERKPNIVPGMTYEEEQAEYARFAEAEAARNDAIAAEAARANAEADSAAAAAAEGAVQADAAKEAFEAEEAQRRAEFEAAEAQRRAEFEARNAQGGEAELGEELDSFSFAAEAPAESPEPSDGFFSESFSESDSSSEGFFAETFAEAPAFSSPFFESDAADTPAAEPARENPDLPFPYSFMATTPTVTPSEKDAILRSAADALGPMLRETAAQALEEYAKRLREEADTEDASFTFPDASFASGEEVANAIENSFEEVVPPSYGAEELANATSASEATETSEAESETPETTETETDEEVPEDVLEEVPEEVSEPESPDAEAPASSAEPAETFAEDEAGSFEEAFAFAPAESEASDEVAFAPAPAESEAFEADAFAPEPSEPEDDALAFLLAEGADAAVAASVSLPDDASDPEVPTGSSEAAEESNIDAIYDAVDDVSAVTQRLEAALGAASAAHHEETKLAVDADGVIVRETKSARAKKAKKESSSSKRSKSPSKSSVSKKSSKTTRLTKAERARGWSDGDETVLRSLSRTSDARASETAGSLTPRRVRELSGSIPGGDAEPAWATIGAKNEKETTKKRSSKADSEMLERSLAVSAEEAAAAAAAADEEALRVDTTLDAVQQAIADQRRDDAPAATLYLAPLSVVGVAGVVVIAILLVRHRDPHPRGTRRDGHGRGAGSIPGKESETTSLLGGERGDVETGGSFPADALVKTSNENLRALFGSVGDFGKERVFATPSETDAESLAAAEGVGRSRAYESRITNHEGSHYSAAANLFDRARAAAEAAERFSSSRVSALRASVERTARRWRRRRGARSRRRG